MATPLPTDYSAELFDLQRRQKYADLMSQQSMEPLEQPRSTPQGWVPKISPLSAIAKMVQGHKAQAGNEFVSERQKALARQMQQDRQGDYSVLAGGQVSPQMISQLKTPEAQAMAMKMLEKQRPTADALLREGGLDRRFSGVSGNTAATIEGANQRHLTPPAAKEEKWSEPYEAGGALVQRNEITGQVRQAVARPPQTHVYSPPAVTTAVVQDPANPSQQLTVDARTYKGGSLGSPGVVGVSGKLGDTAKAEQKLSLGKPQAKLRVETMEQNLDKLDTAITELENNAGLTNITGTVMGRTPNITNKATGAQAQLNSIKSQIFVSALQAMREASKTGGAVGNVSDREGDKLEATLSALDQSQGTPDFKRQLAKARQQLSISKTLIRNAYEEQFGGVQSFGGGQPAASNEWAVVR